MLGSWLLASVYSAILACTTKHRINIIHNTLRLPSALRKDETQVLNHGFTTKAMLLPILKIMEVLKLTKPSDDDIKIHTKVTH